MKLSGFNDGPVRVENGNYSNYTPTPVRVPHRGSKAVHTKQGAPEVHYTLRTTTSDMN
jgi:hypothetical protein